MGDEGRINSQPTGKGRENPNHNKPLKQKQREKAKYVRLGREVRKSVNHAGGEASRRENRWEGALQGVTTQRN